jgi:hypothetical protein
MSEKDLRALLAEARSVVAGTISARALVQRIDDALRMSEDQISIECLREDAFTRGAEAMREAAMGAAWHSCAMGLHKRIKEMPIPEDKE